MRLRNVGLTSHGSRRDIPIHSKVTSNKAKHPNIDTAVFDWFRSIRVLRSCRKPLPVSRALIKARALYEAKRQGVCNFRASDGWFSRWRWRFSVTKSVRLHGEAAGRGGLSGGGTKYAET